MSERTDDTRWWGTSDAPATILRRAQGTSEQRWAELSDLIDLAEATGALARARADKQAALVAAFGLTPSSA